MTKESKGKIDRRDIGYILESRFGKGKHGWDRRRGAFNDDGATFMKRNGTFGMCENEAEMLEAAKTYCEERQQPSDAPIDIDLLQLWRLAKINTPFGEIAEFFGYTVAEFMDIANKHKAIEYLLRKGSAAFKVMIREGQYQLGRGLNENVLMKLGYSELKQRFESEEKPNAAVQINMGDVSGVQAEIRERYNRLRAGESEPADKGSSKKRPILLDGEYSKGNSVD